MARTEQKRKAGSSTGSMPEESDGAVSPSPKGELEGGDTVTLEERKPCPECRNQATWTYELEHRPGDAVTPHRARIVGILVDCPKCGSCSREVGE